MSVGTHIEWTEATWNPVTGCTKISPGCKNCYIERTPPFHMAGRKFVKGRIPLEFHDNRLTQPLRWRKPRRVFVNSLSDLFHADVPDDFIDRVFAVMALCPQHTFQVLTKRPERMAAYITRTGRSITYLDDAARTLGYTLRFDTGNGHPLGLVRWPLPNCWAGTSVEDQPRADERIPHLLRCPAAVRFLSCEPLLGPVDLRNPCAIGRQQGLESAGLPGRIAAEVECTFSDLDGIGWVIVGGESGPGARPCDVAWVRALVGQCRAVGVPCFVKQVGANPYQSFGHVGVEPLKLRDRKGGDPSEWPEDLRVRQFPQPAGAAMGG
jgi:protein gp37